MMVSRLSNLFMVFLLLLMVLAPNLIWWYRAGWSEAGEVGLLPSLLFVFFVLAMAPRIWMAACFLLPFVLLSPFESMYIFEYGRPSTQHIISIISETYFSEAFSYISSKFFLIFFFCSGSFALSVAFVCYMRRGNLELPFRIRIILGAGGFMAIALVACAEVWFMPFDVARAKALGSGKLFVERRSSPAAEIFQDSYPIGVPLRLRKFYSEKKIMLSLAEEVKSFRFGAVQQPVRPQREVYVLVIGETGRPDRWQINGYSRQTNPELSQKANVISFRNMTTPWAWTSMSVPAILTRKPADDSRFFFPERSLISAFHEAGFHTYWLSTQSPTGEHDSSISLHAHEADFVRFLNPADYKSSGVYDGVLLKALADVLRRNEEKQLIVLHTLGGHFNYADRYPPEFEYFRPALKSGISVGVSNFDEVNNAYDNSILYLDHVLSNIIEQLRQEGIVGSMLYVADHGENLYDGNCHDLGHGYNTIFDFRVASIWWATEEFRKAYPEFLVEAKKHINSPLATYNIFYSMLSLAGIKIPNEGHGKNIFSSEWRAYPRPTQAGVDFDNSVEEGECRILKPIRR